MPKVFSRLIFLTLITLSICTFFFSCQKKETLPSIDFKTSYFPLKLGSVIIYKADSTDYRALTPTQSQQTKYSFEIKDSVVRDISEGNVKTFVIYRYKKTGSADWVFEKVLTRTLTGQRAEEFIDNRRFVRLTFPPERNKFWKGNTFNNLDDGSETIYTIKSVDQKRQISSISLDSTLVVEEMKDLNLIRKDYAIAIYAKNIGMVRRIVYSVDNATHPVIDSTKIREGYIYSMELKSFK